MGILIDRRERPSGSESGDALSAYLGEIATVGQLPHAREIALGEQMQRGRSQIVKALIRSPVVVSALDELAASLPGAEDHAGAGETVLEVEPAALDRLRCQVDRFTSLRASGDPADAEALESAEEAVFEALHATGAAHDLTARLLAAHQAAVVHAESSGRDAARDRGLAELSAIATAVAHASQTIVAARETLVRAHLRMVVAAARQFTSRGVALADLIQEGNVGLIIAADRFDHTLGYRFNTYAMWWIRAKLRAAVAHQGRTIRVPIRRLQKVSRILKSARLLANELGREPTAGEVAARVELEPNEVRSLLDIPAEPVRFEALEAADGGSIFDRLEDDSAESPLARLVRAADRTQAVSMLDVLSPREAEVVKLRFGIVARPHTLEEIGRRLGVTRERIRQIEARALQKMRDCKSQRASTHAAGP